MLFSSESARFIAIEKQEAKGNPKKGQKQRKAHSDSLDRQRNFSLTLAILKTWSQQHLLG